jgi:SAM-dependent methyltransferase
MMTADKFVAYDAYETMADGYAALIDTKSHNAYYERPATLSLLPDVDGMRVLDVGCGPGAYSEYLIEHGATVIAIDASPRMVKHAHVRLQGKADIRHHDVREPLVFVQDNTIDLILAPLVLDYSENWFPIFTEFHRILKPESPCIFSIEHPFFKYLYHKTENYLSTEIVSAFWTGFTTAPVLVHSYRRPLNAIFAVIKNTGFTLDKILEPIPTKMFQSVDAAGYDKFSKMPLFMCFKIHAC